MQQPERNVFYNQIQNIVKGFNTYSRYYEKYRHLGKSSLTLKIYSFSIIASYLFWGFNPLQPGVGYLYPLKT